MRVEIDNREFADMQVYLIRDGARVYLGTVNGHSVRTFVVQGPLLAADGRLSLLAGTRTRGDLLVSPIVMAMPGQQVSWRLEFASFGRSVMIR